MTASQTITVPNNAALFLDAEKATLAALPADVIATLIVLDRPTYCDKYRRFRGLATGPRL